MTSFSQRFSFDPRRRLFVGVERECFLTQKGKIVPIAPEVLGAIKDPGFGYELSASQLEARIGPVPKIRVLRALKASDATLQRYKDQLGFGTLHIEVAPYSMPLDVYPDPSGRYQQITKKMPKKILRAACRVAGTHVHIGMPDKESAVRVYNATILHLKELCSMGDKSKGKRLNIYRVMAPQWTPPRYLNWKDYERQAKEQGFDQDPRKCWHLIRISVHGTIEFRMFGATPDITEITLWTHYCHSICRRALNGV